MTRHIYYLSKAYNHIYPKNSNASFQNYININQLDYIISQEEPLSAAVISISFTLGKTLQDQSYQLGLRSTFPLKNSIRSSFYDNIIYSFTLLDIFTVNSSNL